jgi:hypothetical protein
VNGLATVAQHGAAYLVQALGIIRVQVTNLVNVIAGIAGNKPLPARNVAVTALAVVALLFFVPWALRVRKVVKK